jgi:hypothetical protein
VGAGFRPLHTRPERRAGRLRPFWHGAAGCAAGCVKARGLSSACPRFVVYRPVPGGRARRDSDRSTVGSTSTTSWKDLSRRLHHLPESVNIFCDGDPSSRVSCVAHSEEKCSLTWDDSDRGCECLHNRGSENGLFASITARKSDDNCAKQEEGVLTCIFSGSTGIVVAHPGLQDQVARRTAKGALTSGFGWSPAAAAVMRASISRLSD